MDEFLQAVRGDKESVEGEFTIAAERAQRLLAHKALSDIWHAWGCVVQGFYRLGLQSLEISVDRKNVRFAPSFDSPLQLRDLMRDERFLLGWLNLDWFGKAEWNSELSHLQVTWKGFIWKRYVFSRVLRRGFQGLRFGHAPVTLNGSSLSLSDFTKKQKYTLFPSAQGLELPFPLASLPAENWRLSSKPGDTLPSRFAAIAYRSKQSWSQVIWVGHGVVVKVERNTLERPNLSVVACVESLGLKTDLTGFEIVHDESYFEFVRALKSKALWML